MYKIICVIALAYLLNLVGNQDLAIELGQPTMSFWVVLTRGLIALGIIFLSASKIAEKWEEK